MKTSKKKKEDEIVVDLSFEDMIELACTTPKEKVMESIEKEKNIKKKSSAKKSQS